MANASYGYDYFCGANVYISLNGEVCLEVAGISYQMQDSTAPIYGYSSRIFDAVAIGQKIIKGSIVLNFVQPHYLAKLVNLTRQVDHIKIENESIKKDLTGQLTTQDAGYKEEQKLITEERAALLAQADLEKKRLVELLEATGADGSEKILQNLYLCLKIK